MPEGPFPERAFETVGPEREATLRAMVRAAQESPFGWRHYPHSPTDYLTDLWALWQAVNMSLVSAGMWHANVNAGRVHEHRGWLFSWHRQCEPVYVRRAGVAASGG